jgi:hypothetical protein
MPESSRSRVPRGADTVMAVSHSIGWHEGDAGMGPHPG